MFWAGWSDSVPRGLLLALTAWLAGGAMISAAQPEPTSDTWASTRADAPPVALVLPAPLPTSAALSGVRPPDASSTSVTPTAAVVSAEWASSAATATGIPLRALIGYDGAELRLAGEQPACGLGRRTLAALGSIESDHGRNNGSTIDARGVTVPGVFGMPLDGSVHEAFPDTDAGVYDTSTASWRSAVYSYNHVTSYVDLVAARANSYAARMP